MRVVDLAREHEPLYCACLEDWSDEMREAGDHKARWLERMRGRGLRVKLALDDGGGVGGMIQYLPIELTDAIGKGLHFVLCVWVHGYREGRGDFQHRGMGTALLEAAEADARALGSKGMAAWGLALPMWMRASWYRRHGYRTADRRGLVTLVWKPFADDAVAPRWLPRTGRSPETVLGKVVVTGCLNGWCPGQNLAFERARRAAALFGSRVEFRAVDTFERDAIEQWGQMDSLFVDGKAVRTGPPPSQEKLVKIIARRVARLRA